jgi:integrase
MKKKKGRWSYSVGERPHTVTVYEREPGGVLYAGCWDASLRGGAGDMRRISLGHRDKEAARQYAASQHAKLTSGLDEIRTGRVTLGRLLGLYAEHSRTREGEEKRELVREANAAQAEMFVRVFGADQDPHKITEADWQRFIRDRRSGAIDGRGRYVADPEKRRPIRRRTTEKDLRHLQAVLNWGTRWKDREGRYLLRENVTRGYAIPKEKNPRQPVQTEDRHRALLGVADQVTFEVVGRGKRERVRSYLPELLILANETGRRLSSILGLTYEDLNLERRPAAPHGSISWRADLDKKGVAWENVPITATARGALDRVIRDRPGIGSAPLFPSPKDRSKPMDRHLADRWMRQAERLAKIPHQRGGLWHTYRRKAATELKHAPDKDVMQLLGWKDLRSLKSAYQHADPETMLVALETRLQLRGVR